MPSPKAAADVADRLVALKACVVYALGIPPRSVVSSLSARASAAERAAFQEKAEEARYAYWNPVEDSPAFDAMTETERALAETTILTMPIEQQAEAASWLESACVLAWALGLIETLPPWDAPADRGLLSKVPIPAELAAFRARARLRPIEDLERARSVAELWSWRGRTRELEEGGFTLPDDLARDGVKKLEDLVRVTAAHAQVEGAIEQVVDGDFPVRGRAYREIDETTGAILRTIAAERLRALDWLSGRIDRWDTPLT
jgi:hypothetical protein